MKNADPRRQAGLRLVAKDEKIVVTLFGFRIKNPVRAQTNLEWWFDEIVEIFGPARCMLGSDSPVDNLDSDGNSPEQLCELAGQLSRAEGHAVRVGPAARTYRLSFDGSAPAA